MAHFGLGSGKVSQAVPHRTVEEIWFCVSGEGEIWRKQNEREEITRLKPGLCLTIPLGTHFQFRALENSSFCAVAVIMPPWPGEGEAVRVEGKWLPSIE